MFRLTVTGASEVRAPNGTYCCHGKTRAVFVSRVPDYLTGMQSSAEACSEIGNLVGQRSLMRDDVKACVMLKGNSHFYECASF